MAKMFTKLPARGSDTGFIRELGITEAQRDELRKRDWTKAPDPVFNPDTATTEEWVAHRLSGIRANSFTGRVEFWILGQIRKEITIAEAEDPKKFLTAHEEAFATAGSVMETPVRHVSYTDQVKALAAHRKTQAALKNLPKKKR